jgi:hypothetical protein
MSKRGFRRMSMRARVSAIAAAVVVGGGVAGIAIASTGGSTVANSAAFTTRTMSQTQAMSSAMSNWNRSPMTSLSTMTHMQRMTTFSTQKWHRTTIAMQRGTIVAVSSRQKELWVQSSNGTVEAWHWSGGTHVMNVGATATGMTAMTGGTMSATPTAWGGHMNRVTNGLAKGDIAFVFGVKQNRTLKAEMVLFTAPATTTVTPTATPAATASMTATATATPTATPIATSSMTATATPTATPSMTATPTASATATVPAATPTATPVATVSAGATCPAGSEPTMINGETVCVGAKS